MSYSSIPHMQDWAEIQGRLGALEDALHQARLDILDLKNATTPKREMCEEFYTITIQPFNATRYFGCMKTRGHVGSHENRPSDPNVRATITWTKED